MVGRLEADGGYPHDLPLGHHQADDQSRALRDPASTSHGCLATSSEHPQEVRTLQARADPQVRQCTRPFQPVHGVRSGFQMGQSRREVGSASWAKRALFAIATLASTFFGNHYDQGHFESPPSFLEELTGSPSGLHHQVIKQETPPTVAPGSTPIWTTFNMDSLIMDHLNEQEQLEVFQIVQQESPLDATPATWEQHAFLHEDYFEDARNELARRQDMRRWERLHQLGVLRSESDEENFDWALVSDP